MTTLVHASEMLCALGRSLIEATPDDALPKLPVYRLLARQHTPQEARWTLFLHGRPPTMNSHINHHQKRRFRQYARRFALEQNAPSFSTRRVDIHVLQTCLRHPLPDPGNIATVVKPLVDGLVDAGVLADDSGRYVHRVTYHAPLVGLVDAVSLTLLPFAERQGAG